MCRRVRYAVAPLLVLLAAVLAATTVAPPSAQAAWRAPCVPGANRPTCIFWSAKVVFVADGDTIRVKLSDDPTHAVKTIRFTGINAMEMTHYSKSARNWSGACHAIAATSLVDRAIRRSHRVVRLAAQHAASSTGARHRLRRSVWVKVDGRWRDLARLEMEQGLALWMPNPNEYAHNLEYRILAQKAASARLGLYNPQGCGAGPDADIPLDVSVNWDADGNDKRNLNGEWVQVTNRGGRDVSLRGWWVRDSWLTYGAGHVPGYPFPAGARVPAGGSVRVHVGCGQDTDTDFHWCRHASAFENVTHDARHMGDGGYLFDPRGNLRASMTYPCAAPCWDPLEGAVKLSVHASTPEWIAVTNTSSGVVDLQGYLLKLHLGGRRDKFIWARPFRAGDTIAPGETLRMWLQGSPSSDTRLERHLGMRNYVLADGGNAVSIQTYADAVVACAAWGRASC